MGMVNVIWSGLSILVILTAGVVFFNEVVTTYDKVGVILIIAGMAFILWETEHDHFAHFRIF
jgi:multidrug transporter EmrE-like cation transporter